jgi:hypothetical protein
MDLPLSGVQPVTIPGDVVLVRRPELAIWAGAVSAYPGGFMFTVLALFDIRRGLPEGVPWDGSRFHQQTLLAVRFSDGRYREVTESSLNRPPGQAEGPHLRAVDGAANWTGGWWYSRWWVTPLPSPGPVELAVRFDGTGIPGGTGKLDGAAVAAAGTSAGVLWPDSEN